MAHWLKDYAGLEELQTDYDDALEEWRQLKGSDPEAAYAYRQETLNPIADEFAKARDHWRNIGTSTGERTGIKVEDNVQ